MSNLLHQSPVESSGTVYHHHHGEAGLGHHGGGLDDVVHRDVGHQVYIALCSTGVLKLCISAMSLPGQILLEP